MIHFFQVMFHVYLKILHIYIYIYMVREQMLPDYIWFKCIYMHKYKYEYHICT